MELQLTEESIKLYLERNYNEDLLIQQVDDAKSDYLDDDWQDEFDDEEDAYQETGRGEAEAQVRMEIERDILTKLNIEYFEFERQVGKTISDIITDVYSCLEE